MRGLVLAVSVLALIWGCGGVAPPPGDGGPTPAAGGPSGTDGGTTSGSGPHVQSAGIVVVEAEHFSRSAANAGGTRQWYAQAGGPVGPGPDPDGFHDGASGNTYMEILPDTRVAEHDPLTGDAFVDSGPGGATMEYDIIFDTPGVYFVWVRAFSTGTEDNGLHVGIDGTIYETGLKMQWCGTGQWSWSNAQRGSGGSSCGQAGTIMVNVPSAGFHTVSFHQREDGFEFDRFMLTTDGSYRPDGAGPVESPRQYP